MLYVRVSWSHLHGAPAHGEHLEQGDGLHVFAASCSAAATGFSTFALDILWACVCSFSPSLRVKKKALIRK